MCSLYCEDGEVDIPVARQLIDGLNSCIEEGLQSRQYIFGLRHPLGQPPKPIWDFHLKQLWFEGELVRSVKKEGTDIKVVLNSFQKEGWPERIENPFLNDSQLTPTKISELVDSLNEHLTLIRFHADGTGRGIIWRRDPTRGTP